MKPFGHAAIFVLLIAANARGQTLQSQTTWGAPGAEFSCGVAVAPDGSAYLTGTSDSFAVDEVGIPEARIFLLRFTANGALDWQRIWNGPSVHTKSSVALGSDGSVYVAGLSKSNDGDAVLYRPARRGAAGRRHRRRQQSARGSADAAARELRDEGRPSVRITVTAVIGVGCFFGVGPDIGK